MKRALAAGCGLALLLLAPWLRAEEGAIYDDFAGGRLDTSRWSVTAEGDFKAVVVTVAGGRLRLHADTRDTSFSMKHLGLRSKEALDLGVPTTISWDLDWNDQRNGSYLTAGVYLCPSIRNNPRQEPDWLAFQYSGVPPGRNLRTDVQLQTHGSLKKLYEDWGPRDEQGRPLGRPIGAGRHTLRLDIREGALRVREDGVELCSFPPGTVPFRSAYLYLQMASGPGYPARELYFDNVSVTAGAAAPPE